MELVRVNLQWGLGKIKNFQKVKCGIHPPPPLEYYEKLFRVSKNQIIWGGNYFINVLPISKSWIVWDKLLNKDISFSDGELAWTSFTRPLKIAKIQYSGFLGMDLERIHPTQKPVKLYEWCLVNFAKEGDKILDTHLGSQSSRIAAYKLGFDFWGFEIDKDYFEQGNQRFENESKLICHNDDLF